MCYWTEDDNPPLNWETECGNVQEHTGEQPIELGWKHCPFCGERIHTTAYHDPYWRHVYRYKTTELFA